VKGTIKTPLRGVRGDSLTPELSGAPLLRVRLERQVSEVIGLSAARRMEETGGGCFDLAIIPRLLKKTCDFSIA